MIVFVPHSDDEVLAAGGLIQQMTNSGSPPQVVLVTGGDGFKLGAEARYKGRPTPSMMMDYARHRLGESKEALSRLGLPPDKFTFLGFPDQGLHRLWLECWAANPCTSATTQAGKVPYSEAWRPAAPYTGEELEGEIRDLLRAARPAVVVYPHPNEAHVDHWALSNFVSAALEDLRRTEPDWTPPEEWFYLVHRGDWPAPKGYRPQDPLLPPASMASGMTTWHERSLTPEQVQKKDQALLAYQSQVSLMRRYLTSFVRTNELFGTIDRVQLPTPLMLPGQAPLNGPPWRNLAWAEVITDPRADTMARGVERGADAGGVWAARDATTLWLATRMGARPRPPVEVRFYARGFHTGMGWGDLAGLVVYPDGSHSIEAWPGQTGKEDLVTGVESIWVRVGIPLAVLGNPESAMINVETRVEGVLVDRTAWRPVSLDER
jgi:LmbE family N-acetylglucosaminyl deacetylase